MSVVFISRFRENVRRKSIWRWNEEAKFTSVETLNIQDHLIWPRPESSHQRSLRVHTSTASPAHYKAWHHAVPNEAMQTDSKSHLFPRRMPELLENHFEKTRTFIKGWFIASFHLYIAVYCICPCVLSSAILFTAYICHVSALWFTSTATLHRLELKLSVFSFRSCCQCVSFMRLFQAWLKAQGPTRIQSSLLNVFLGAQSRAGRS